MVESALLTRLEESFEYSPSALVATFHYYREHPDEAQADGYDRDPDTRVFRRHANQQAIASKAYANEYGNRDAASGDGWRYRGRGLLGLTFADNYRDAGEALATDYLRNPDLVVQPRDACLAAAWYWHARKLNLLADAGSIDAVTRAINPAMEAADMRRRLTLKAQRALGA